MTVTRRVQLFPLNYWFHGNLNLLFLSFVSSVTGRAVIFDYFILSDQQNMRCHLLCFRLEVIRKYLILFTQKIHMFKYTANETIPELWLAKWIGIIIQIELYLTQNLIWSGRS